MSNKPVYRTRFAPSPTGLMHLGNARTALFNALYAKHLGGTCLLRIEDTDRQRSKPAYTEQILKDLAWLGIEWEGEHGAKPFFQSERTTIYEAYYVDLLKQNKAYPCFCTETELAVSRKAQAMQGKPPRYKGPCATLSATKTAEKLAEGQPHALRFRVPPGQRIVYTDLIKGEQHFLSDDIGDFIIRRSDGTAAFFFCNAVDDALMGVTHALRGEDHVSNTPRQHLILSALGLAIPHYGHFPTILGSDGSPLSKRNGSRSIQALQSLGYDSLAVVNYMARLGHYYGENTLFDLASLGHRFSLTSVSQSPAHFDENQLAFFQKSAIQTMPFPAFAGLCSDYMASHHRDFEHFTASPTEWEAFLKLMQSNVTLPQEVFAFAERFFRDTQDWSSEEQACLSAAGKVFFEAVQDILSMQPDLGYRDLVTHLTKKTTYKGKALYQPLRLLISQTLIGPELEKLYNLRTAKQIQEKAQAILKTLETPVL